MVISILCLVVCLIYAFLSKLPDDSNGRLGSAVLRAFPTSMIFFIGKFIGVTIYYMTGPPRLMTILLRNLPGVLAFLIFVVLLRFSKKFDISRKK